MFENASVVKESEIFKGANNPMAVGKHKIYFESGCDVSVITVYDKIKYSYSGTYFTLHFDNFSVLNLALAIDVLDFRSPLSSVYEI